MRKDGWNIRGVSWINKNIAREMVRTSEEGRRLATRFLLEKLVFLLVVTVVLFSCAFFLSPEIALIVEMVVLFASIAYLKRMSVRSMAPVYERGDPYLQFSYVRAWVENPIPKTKQSLVRHILSLAQCMALAGESESALHIQGMLQEDELRIQEKSIYFNTLLLCYSQTNQRGRRIALTSHIRELAATAKPKAAMYLQVILELEEVKNRQEMGDVEYVEAYFRRVPPKHGFQAVGMHYALAMMYIKLGDAESARPHVAFVLERGNKLYYKKELEAYLRRSLESEEENEF